MKLNSQLTNLKEALKDTKWEYMDIVSNPNETITISAISDAAYIEKIREKYESSTPLHTEVTMPRPLTVYGHNEIRHLLLVVSDKLVFTIFKVHYIEYMPFLLDLKQGTIANKYPHIATARCETKNELDFFLKVCCTNFNFSN